ncbi:thioesterase family protein [Micromonospora sp. NPDC049799]|uniref:acyl-CoA thioesterase n=1 Tax=Micromonospora sp. NPDC049799 TaxID=3154741 RepID=UPI0033FF6024
MSNATIEQPAVEFGHVERVPVHFDDLDALGILHNARYAVLLERALTPYWADRGVSYQGGRTSAPDVFHAVREFTITYRTPITGTGPVAVHFWLEHFGTSSAEYAFQFRSVDGRTLHAEGRRAIVRLDPATLRPTAWTETGRAVAATLLRPAPAGLTADQGR